MVERLADLALCAAVATPADAAPCIDPIDRKMTLCLDDPEHASTAGQHMRSSTEARNGHQHPRKVRQNR
ncbi:hypothetical protein [Burkholderia lata]|uniref:hypothetical protein n=1 Tax=Burkholderia lata (strain ATCC 17760 / DSM 23089 / LMG 22485 / NCIMB 9086 / R18194 / 383) TaxID=482957 RepID=UPI00145436B9|nr:hypothetical protein [Burkholderia lata]VWB79877.1 hypothetical protein BLA15816_03812 [Burkholderia lata]